MRTFDTLIGPAARAAMREDRRIREVISRIVPADSLAHVTFCRAEGRQLKVTMDSAAWIPKLRFCERSLLTALAIDGLELRTVTWHVAPAAEPVGRRTRSRVARGGSARAARALMSAVPGESGGSADELSRQLERLATRLLDRDGDGQPGD